MTSVRVEVRSARSFACGIGRGNVEPGLGRELLHRIHELHAAVVGEEADRVAVRAAAEAMVEALVVVDGEAGRLLVVERAAGLPLAPGADQLHRRRDHGGKDRSSAKLVEEGGREGHQEGQSVAPRLTHSQARGAELSTGASNRRGSETSHEQRLISKRFIPCKKRGDQRLICPRSDTKRQKIAERDESGRDFMLNKIGGLARALYIVLAIVAGFVALSMMNVPLVLVVLGLIAGLRCPGTEWSCRGARHRAADRRQRPWAHPDDRRTAHRGLPPISRWASPVHSPRAIAIVLYRL